MKNVKIYNGLYTKLKRITAGALVGLTLAAPVIAKADGNNTNSRSTEVTIANSQANLEQQLINAGMFVNQEDILAYRFLTNIEANAAYVEAHGSLPASYAALDLASLDFEQLYNMANRINDAIGNTMLDPETQIVDPSLAVDNINSTHEQLIKRASSCVERVAAATLESWLDPESSLLDNASACAAINEFMNLVRQARTLLTAGEYETIFLGTIQNMGGYIVMDGGLANEYIEAYKGLGTACDFTVAYEPDGQSMILVNPVRTAELTKSIRQKLGYQQVNCNVR